MRLAAALFPVALIAAACSASSTETGEQAEAPEDRREERVEMVDRQIEARGVTDPAVLAAMREVPRHRFVPDEHSDRAYGDHPLPIGHGQTISQPMIVGMMSQALQAPPGARVLEVGTGSGYQAAVLAEMGYEVFTIEIVPQLAERATAVLHDLGYDARVRLDDGYLGWEDEGTFDAIIVTAAPDHVPQPLIQQLAPGARLVIPVGPIGAVHTLWIFSVDDSGEVVGESLGPVRFVPLTRSE